jgi:hypothetical protein
MAWDEDTAERVRALLSRRRAVVEKKLMGTLAFMVNGSCAARWDGTDSWSASTPTSASNS